MIFKLSSLSTLINQIEYSSNNAGFLLHESLAQSIVDNFLS